MRGLGPEYTLTTFNGRILATDGAGRDFAFDVLPADVISGADVIKGAQAALTEGAIGGLINLRSASPFDQKGQHGIVRLEGDRNQMSKLNGHKFSATYSNTFANDTMGVLFGVVEAKRKDRTDVAGNDGGWTRNPDPNDPNWWRQRLGRQHRSQWQRRTGPERIRPDRPWPVPGRFDPGGQEAHAPTPASSSGARATRCASWWTG